MSISVEDHYSSDGIVDRILAALPQPLAIPLQAAQLYPFDQFHGREIHATRDHTALLNPQPTDHILDIGSGIGGPARYLAATYQSHVTGVDLTAKFTEAARELTKRCALDASVKFFHADAAKLPFEANHFDHAICFYVGMNLPDKPAVLAEALRVLKPGGRLIWTEVAQITPPTFPLPWATDPANSHLSPSDTLLGNFSSAGFTIDSVQDEAQSHITLAQKMQQSGLKPSPEHIQANAVVFGPDFIQRRKNYIQNLAAGNIASLVIQARKPG